MQLHMQKCKINSNAKSTTLFYRHATANANFANLTALQKLQRYSIGMLPFNKI
jgi:hypothetical protein